MEKIGKRDPQSSSGDIVKGNILKTTGINIILLMLYAITLFIY